MEAISTLPLVTYERMTIPPAIKRLLAAIRQLAQQTGVAPRYVTDFNRLYRFYMEVEESLADEQRTGSSGRNSQVEPGTLREVPGSPELRAYVEGAAAARARYAHRIEYYLLLKSFYNAFVFPLEQAVAIARSCQVLGVNAIAFTGGKEITPTQLEAALSGETLAALATMRDAFEAIGRISFPDIFNANDFTNANPDQA